MDRREAWSLIAPYVDGELSRDTAREFEAYLTEDPRCKAEVETLGEFRSLLKSAFPPLEAPPYLRKRIERLARGGDAWPRGRKFPARAVSLATIAAILVGVLAVTLFPRGHTPLSVFVLDHLDYSEPGKGLEFQGSDASALSEWFSKRLPFFPRIPRLKAELEGGRRCHIGEIPVALAFYEWQGRRISLFVGEGSRLRVKGLPRAAVTPKEAPLFFVEKGHTAAVWEEFGLIYVLVTALPQTQLEEFIKEWKDHGDA